MWWIVLFEVKNSLFSGSPYNNDKCKQQWLSCGLERERGRHGGSLSWTSKDDSAPDSFLSVHLTHREGDVFAVFRDTRVQALHKNMMVIGSGRRMALKGLETISLVTITSVTFSFLVSLTLMLTFMVHHYISDSGTVPPHPPPISLNSTFFFSLYSAFWPFTLHMTLCISKDVSWFPMLTEVPLWIRPITIPTAPPD